LANKTVEVYCDAGISPASMKSPTSGQLLPELVGRVIVVIPALDFCHIEQMKEGFRNKKDKPAIAALETIAVRRSKEICLQKGMANFTILTDSKSVASDSRIAEAQWLEPGRLQLASLLLQRIVNRAKYLRRSSRKVISRAPLTEVQKDAFRLFNAENLDFVLSRSAVWNKIQAEIAAATGAGQEHL